MITTPLVSPAFIGRVEELEVLRKALAEASQGQGQTVFISGEAGIGKSRLVSVLSTSFEGITLTGRCYQEEGIFPLAPLTNALRQAMKPTSAGELRQLIESRSTDLTGLLPEFKGEQASSSPPSNPEVNQQRLFAALVGLLSDLAVHLPVLFVLEDLHWSDTSTLDFVRYLARRVAGQRILFIVTYRSAEATSPLASLLAQFNRERLGHAVDLQPFSPAEIEAMLRAIFDIPQPVRVEFLERVVTFSEGNPFYVEELLDAWLASGEIYQANGVWKRKPVDELNIPHSVQEAVERRLAHLSKPARQVLSLASIAGKRFNFELLHELTQIQEADLTESIKELLAAHFIVEETADEFAFRHTLIREAVYAQMLKRERRALHQEMAEALERIPSHESEAHAAELAQHYFKGGVWQKAMVHSWQAAQQALSLNASHEALAHITSAANCAQALNIPLTFELLFTRGRLNEVLGNYKAAQIDLAAALETAQGSGNIHEQWQALLGLGFLWTAKDYDQSLTWFERALATTSQMSDPRTRAQTLNRIGNVYLNRDLPNQALPYHEEALSLFTQAQDLAGQAETLELLAVTCYNLSDVRKGVEYDERSLEISRQIKDGPGIFHAALHLLLPVQLETEVGPPVDPAHLQELGEMALRMARETSWLVGEAQAFSFLGELHGILGNYDRALQHLQSGLALARQSDHRAGMAAGERMLARVMLDLCAYEQARQHLERAQALAKEAGAQMFAHIAEVMLARVMMATGSPDDLLLAGQLLGEAPLEWIPPRSRSERENWLAQAELKLAQGDPVSALQIIEGLISSTLHIETHGLESVPRLAKLRGDCLLDLRRFSEAESALRAAKDGAVAQHRRPLYWRILASLYKLYRAQKRSTEAQEAFKQAHLLVEELAAGLQDSGLREAFRRRALSTLPAPRPLTQTRVAKQAAGGLTRREREIAALIAQGKSNRQIAQALVISERTAERHVTNILSRLGFESRVQIAAWAVEKGLK